MKHINYVDIDMADNGFIVSWSEKQKSSGSMDHCGYVNRSRVFEMDDEEEAWEFYKEKKMQCIMPEKKKSFNSSMEKDEEY